MNNDLTNEEFFEELAKLCPELMEKSNIEYFAVGKGWNNIIRVLCNCLYSEVHHAKSRLKAAILYPGENADAHRAACELSVQQEIDNLPSIMQVKEKFGTLRFYATGGTDRTYSMIQFAEAMSALTCEVCGDQGSIDRNGGWYKTHCAKHRKPDTSRSPIREGRTVPNLFSD